MTARRYEGQGVRLEDLVGRPFGEVSAALVVAGVSVATRDERLPPFLAVADRARPLEKARPGDHVVAHLVGDRVVRFSVDRAATRDAEEQAREQRLADIERRLDAVEKKTARRRPPAKKPAPKKPPAKKPPPRKKAGDEG